MAKVEYGFGFFQNMYSGSDRKRFGLNRADFEYKRDFLTVRIPDIAKMFALQRDQYGKWIEMPVEHLDHSFT